MNKSLDTAGQIRFNAWLHIRDIIDYESWLSDLWSDKGSYNYCICHKKGDHLQPTSLFSDLLKMIH